MSRFLDEIGHVGTHAQFESWIAGGAGRDEIEEVPLRHERDELAMRRQAREVRKCYRRIAELRAEHARFLMRQLQKVIEDTQLVHHFERRRMNSVAAEVAQKIGVLLEHENVDPGPREQKREHHPGGSATRDTAARGELFHGDSVSPPEVAVEMTNVDAGGALVSSSEARHFQRSSQSSRTA